MGADVIRVLWYLWGCLNVVLGGLLAYSGAHYPSAVFLTFGAVALAVAAWVLT